MPETKSDTSKTSGNTDEIRVSKWNLSELRIACDDHISKYLTEKSGYVQNFRHVDIRLALGYIASILAIYAFYHGYVHSFEESKLVAWVCVVGYAVLSSASILYSYFVEKHCIFEGTKKGAKTPFKLCINAHHKRYSDVYEINATLTKSSDNSKPINNSISRSFSAWFDTEGRLVESALEEELRALVEKCEAGLHQE
ncbi:uncharacterized protein VTP21DRAFT_7272 [Calcarisporiella thermophila]|uniref:uncharacterized protein n=1 Tax=Calcarisporiella thermophila TaxID=911321 RepID=UPI00374287C5